jgi:hypothetical protein
MVNSVIFLLDLNLASTWSVLPMIPSPKPHNLAAVWPGRGLLESKKRQWPRILLTTLMTGLMLMNYETAAQVAKTPSGLTCNINGIPPQERARYGRLFEALGHAMKERRELPDGYAFQIDTGRIGTGQLVEWIELERQCCPFFGFEVRWDQQNGAVWLHLTGPEGVKDFILDEFGLR